MGVGRAGERRGGGEEAGEPYARSGGRRAKRRRGARGRRRGAGGEKGAGVPNLPDKGPRPVRPSRKRNTVYNEACMLL